MTNEQKQVKDWMQAFGQECPERPMIPSIEVRRLRAKLVLEEAVEKITKGLGLDIFIGLGRRDCKLGPCSKIDFVDNGEPNLEQIADGCSDLSVVNYGTLVACGLVKENEGKPGYESEDPLFNEVMRSNWTKLWMRDEIHDGESKSVRFNPNFTANEVLAHKWLVKDRDGKVIKSPSYSPANLTPIINGLSS